MLCPTCPKRETCKQSCSELSQELSKLERSRFQTLRSPQQIEKVERHNAKKLLFSKENTVDTTNEEPEIDSTIAYQKLNAIIIFLPFRQRDCLRLHYWEDLSQGEIAESLRISQQAVSRSLNRAHEKIKTEYLL